MPASSVTHGSIPLHIQLSPKTVRAQRALSEASSDTESANSIFDVPQPRGERAVPSSAPLQLLEPQNGAVGLRQRLASVTNSTQASSVSGDSRVTTQSVQTARAKSLSVLTGEVAKATKSARSITKVMSLAGLGVSMGLLFAGQPFAVVLLVPAFAAIGVGLSWAMRKRLDNGKNASIVAFKEMMASPSAETLASPHYAQAQKLYSFLNDSYMQQAKNHLNDTFAKLTRNANKATTTSAPVHDTQDTASEITANDSASQVGTLDTDYDAGSEDGTHTSSSSRLTADNLSLLQQTLHEASRQNSISPNRSQMSFGDLRHTPQFEMIPIALDVRSQAAVSVNSEGTQHSEAPSRIAESFHPKQVYMKAWQDEHTDIDPNKTFSADDMKAYDDFVSTILLSPPNKALPIQSLGTKVLKAFGIDPGDRLTTMTAAELKQRLNW